MLNELLGLFSQKIKTIINFYLKKYNISKIVIKNKRRKKHLHKPQLNNIQTFPKEEDEN